MISSPVLEYMKKVLRVYYRAGFTVRYMLMDGEFEKVKAELPSIVCNTTAAKEHVAEAERHIRSVKERSRGIRATLPFSSIPKRVKIELIYFIVCWLNAFPVKSGISRQFSPREIVLRWQLDIKRHCRVMFGEYCEVHDELDPTNTQVSKTHEALALGPTRNSQGTVKFFCLETGRVLKRRNFTIYPMPDRVIKKVNTVGLAQGQGRELAFRNRNKEPFEWEDEVPEDDSEFQGLLESKATFPDISAEIPGVSLESELPTTAVEEPPEPDEEACAGAARANADINAAEFHQPAAIEADPAEIVINVELPEDIAGVYPAATAATQLQQQPAAAAQLQQQQNQYNIPQAAEAVPADIQDIEDDGNGGVSGEDTESDAGGIRGFGKQFRLRSKQRPER